MRIVSTAISGLVQIALDMHKDSRGFFVETWRDDWSKALGLQTAFVQDNHARSEAKGVVRGLHFQAPPYEQSKLIWVVRGAVYDVAVDMRVGSPTYGAWHGLLLSPDNALRFFIPKGFAHGYMTLEEGTEVCYKVDSYYAPQAEGGVYWDDPALAIAWPKMSVLLSAKDQVLPRFADVVSPFVYSK